MRGARRITLDDIAKEIGITKVSVSKALRDHPDISADTKVKVREVAKKLGYTPNFIARSLSSNRSNTIGVVVPKIAHSFFSAIIESVYATASRNNFEIILCVSQENAVTERKHIETLLGMRVDGILISVSEETTDPAPFQNVAAAGVPLVMFDRTMDGLEFSTVTVDDRGGAQEGVSYLIQQGYTEIAHLAGYDSVKIGRSRRLGYEEALRAAGLPIRHEMVFEGGFSERDGYYGFKELHESGPIPEAIFAVTYPVGLGVYDAALDLGIPLSAFKLLAFGGSDVNRFLSEPMVCIDQPAREVGSRAVSLLIDEIENRNAPRNQHVVLPTRIQVAATRAEGTRMARTHT